jgi:hypothetical protein
MASRTPHAHFVGVGCVGGMCAQGVLFHSDRMGDRPLINKVPRYFKKYVDFFIDLCQQDFAFQQYLPSVLASAVVVASRKALRIK